MIERANIMDTTETIPLAHPVAVVEIDPTLRTRLAMELGEGAPTASYPTIGAVEERLSSGTPTVVIFGPSYAGAAGLQAIEQLTRRPEVGALLVVDELNTEVLRDALRAGVRDVIALPVDRVQLAEAIERVAQTTWVPSDTASTGATSLPAAEPGSVITVFSTKGGIGRSVIASNLAVSLARRAEGRVVLVDADLKFGDVAMMLGLNPRRSILDAVQAMHRLDAELLGGLLTRHEPSGLLLLAAPLEPGFADQVGVPDMLKIVQLLRTFCEYVVIDTRADDDDIVRVALEESDEILLIAGMEIPSVKHVKVSVSLMRELNIPSAKFKLVVNRANSKVRLDAGEIERTLQIRASSHLPSDIAVPKALNKGVPIVLDAPKSEFARKIDRLAEVFLAGTRVRR
jgi:pilus assembly protein CpaE